MKEPLALTGLDIYSALTESGLYLHCLHMEKQAFSSVVIFQWLFTMILEVNLIYNGYSLEALL